MGAGRYDGGDGTDTLQIGTTGDFCSAATDGADGFISIEGIKFVNGFGISTATFDAAQFGAGKISLTSTITGDAGTQGLVINLAPGESLDLSGLSFSAWTSGTDIINIDGSTGGETIVGTSQSDTIFTGGGGIDVLTGGGGRDTFVYTGADSTLQIGGGSGTIGSVTGFGLITDFAPGATAATSELLGFSARSIGSSFTTNDSTLLLHTGATIRSHTISNGIVTFNDGSGSQSLITLGDVAAATQYLSFNDWGSAGATLAFTATISGVTHTFVYTQTTSLSRYHERCNGRSGQRFGDQHCNQWHDAERARPDCAECAVDHVDPGEWRRRHQCRRGLGRHAGGGEPVGHRRDFERHADHQLGRPGGQLHAPGGRHSCR